MPNSGQRWTDNGGTASGSVTNRLGGSGGVVAWSIAGAGLTNQSGNSTFFSGSTVALPTNYESICGQPSMRGLLLPILSS